MTDDVRVEAALERAHAVARAHAWPLVPVAERTARAARLAHTLREHREGLAHLVVAEMGKPVGEAEGEVDKSAVTAEYYAAQGPGILADERVAVDGAETWVAHEPAGPVLAVIPWNFPVWQVMRVAVPSLVAGNGVLLKHASNVTGSALALRDLFVEAGFPEHLVTAPVVADTDVPDVTARLIQDDRVAAVTSGPPSWRTPGRACLPSTRRPSARWPPWPSPAMTTTPYGRPTRPPSAGA
ncbi:aldehyde dehydrogenase family protein [Streptomyces sp. NPDC001858]